MDKEFKSAMNEILKEYGTDVDALLDKEGDRMRFIHTIVGDIIDDDELAKQGAETIKFMLRAQDDLDFIDTKEKKVAVLHIVMCFSKISLATIIDKFIRSKDIRIRRIVKEDDDD